MAVPSCGPARGVTPAVAGAIVGAHPRRRCDRRGDEREVVRTLAEAALEDDGRAPRAAARDEQLVPADVDELAAVAVTDYRRSPR